MPRVIGIDPGTVSLDLCGLDEGRVFLDRSIPTPAALADPGLVVGLLESVAPLDLVVGPSGYGLPVTAMRDLTETDLRLACLSATGEPGGIGGLASLMRALAHATVTVVVTPGVVHLASVPTYRKANRVDMGTADKVCATALAIHEQAERRRCRARDVSLILLELGGAFTAATAVDRGRIVDGLGGSSGPMGATASGALDAEVAFLAERVTKAMVFSGGALTIAGTPDARAETLVAAETPRGRMAWEAYVESAVKAVASLAVSAPRARDVVLSGRLARVDGVGRLLAARLSATSGQLSVSILEGLGTAAKHAAQGAALLADGLSGGRSADLVDGLGLRQASGTALDHLYLISPAAARARLGIR